MNPKLGSQFMNAAAGPTSYAGRCIMARQVDAGLAQLTAECLLGAVERGVDNVARAVGCKPAAVAKDLPMDALRALGQRIDLGQQAAVTQWQIHTGHLGGLLAGVADLTVDGRPPDVALCLLRLSKKMQLDKALAEPLRRLSEDLDRWQALLEQCRSIIEQGRALGEAYRRRRFVRLAGLSAGLLVLLGAGGWAYLWTMARSRVQALLDASDPCAVERVAEGDVGRASAAQVRAMAVERQACAALRERQVREAEARRRAMELQREREAERRQREAACERLAAHVESGRFEAADRKQAGEAANLLAKVAWRRLGVPEVTGRLPALPCGETAGGKRLATMVARELMAAAPRWITLATPSDSVRALLVAQRAKVPRKLLELFEGHIEEVARRALRSGEGGLMDRALQLCKLEGELGLRQRDTCQAALRVAKRR